MAARCGSWPRRSGSEACSAPAALVSSLLRRNVGVLRPQVTPASARASDPLLAGRGTGRGIRMRVAFYKRQARELGAARAREPGYGSKRSQDGEAQRTCREPRPGRPRRTSGDGHGQPRAARRTRSPSLTRLGFLMQQTSGDGHGQSRAARSTRSPSLTRLGFLMQQTSGDGYGQPRAARQPPGRAPQVANLRPLRRGARCGGRV